MNNAKKQKKTTEWERQKYPQENWRSKGKLNARRDMIKDRKRKAVTEVEEVKKRWQEHTELY